jgi:hypothetical protein
MKFRRKSKHLDSPCPSELFPNIDLTTLCQVLHHGMLVRSLVAQDGGVDEADKALFKARVQTLPCAACSLQPAFRVPILSTSSGFGSRGKYRNRSTEIKKYCTKKERGKREKGKQKFIYAYTPLGSSSCTY